MSVMAIRGRELTRESLGRTSTWSAEGSGSIEIHDREVADQLAQASRREMEQIERLKGTSRGRGMGSSQLYRPRSSPTGGSRNMYRDQREVRSAHSSRTNSAISQTDKIQDWLNKKSVQGIQEKYDPSSKDTKRMYSQLLKEEDTFVQGLQSMVDYKGFLDLRKREILHKKWEERVHDPLRREIRREMNGPTYPELDRTKRTLHQKYLDYHNKKGTVFLDTMSPKEYDPLILISNRPQPLKAQTSLLRDPLISQGRERTDEDRTVIRCLTGKTLSERDVEQHRLPQLPLVPLGRHGTECQTWLAMPLTDINSDTRQKSRRRMHGNYSTSHFDFPTTWSVQQEEPFSLVMEEWENDKRSMYGHQRLPFASVAPVRS
ncbi:Hypp251 [Branchiostoma lanceolatum]|uniref:Hypp251 protein n=1 Tax=Branchiostoma lanceolatum TaxID=7740 RepID=A0A8J9W2W4_BRALA|nr:Hypp251 [Branchiostoma lanceolatum]